MSSRTDIARRHRLPERMAAELHGDTDEELEADAAAKAGILRMVGAPVGEPIEPPPEGLPAPDKPIVDYTAEERQAVHADLERKQAQREAADATAQESTPDIYTASYADHLAAKRYATERLVRRLHDCEEPLPALAPSGIKPTDKLDLAPNRALYKYEWTSDV